MSDPRDLDIFARSLGGDWQSRAELFRKFIWNNPRVREAGTAYRQMEDFLHDSFTNVLRTGISFNMASDLGDWVESVAVWTALERERLRDIDATGASGRVRMCAAIEGDEADHRARLTSYVPPRRGAEDSLASRISAFVGEPQFKLLLKRTREGSTWQDVADAAGKPLITIGPILVRTIDRLSRCFGAPPPLNADLESVFSLIAREDAKAKHANPSKSKGRVASMQLDPAFYAATPELRTIGLSVPAEVRTMVLWDTARTSTPPGEALREHLAKCNYCADVLRAMLLMHQALQSDPGVEFLLCPGAVTLLNTPENAYPALDQHLAECAVCSEERTRIPSSAGSPAQPGPVAGKNSADVKKKVAWAAAAVFVLGGGFFALRYFSDTSTPTVQSAVEPPAPQVAANPRYRDLAQNIPVNDMKWFATVLPQNRELFGQLVDLLQKGRVGEASLTASGFGDRDPGIEMLYAVLLYDQNMTSDGYRVMLKSEAMNPRNPFRCWALMQCALIVGDMKTVAREVDHLSSDPEYADRAKALLARARARG